MTTRMLIDARHPEETRVAVLKGNRIDEFDFDSADHKQIKGNIYLAKVTRVEPSLQAAFVDFGGNRHGFLAFSEIHPDYYQIPKEDREALLAEEAAHAEEEAALRRLAEGEEDFIGDDELGESLADDLAEGHAGESGSVTEVDTPDRNDVATIEAGHIDNIDNGFDDDPDDNPENDEDEGRESRGRRRQGAGHGGSRAKAADAIRAQRMALRRRYKIQDVIHRRQVLLVQVVKEERGNKGAALTSYLSLAGRYCVLMPNSSHGGGISRKISSVVDRKRLKSIIAELDLPKTMGCIVRTAGLQRTKTEIKRDFDYLARLWDDIRDTTLKSSAPVLIHSDSDLIKRAIRDIYSREIEDVVVEGEAGYRDARDFMKLLMPSHARRVKQYADPVPLFQRYGAEGQLSALYDPVVQLRSGGYIVINPTEALVSIDINSGRSTKEHGIEATAVNTNLEAAHEIARQLRLRDMAGLIVIDFIDMEHGSNIRKVEKAVKEALKNDRARIQVGRISPFGLMEMSRQRLRTGMLEATTRTCPHCDGSGLVRNAASAGLTALRLIEDEAAKGKGTTISLFASQEATIYVLNAKRADLAEIETRYGVAVEVFPEGEDEGAKMRVASSGPRNDFVPRFDTVTFAEDEEDLPDEDLDDEDAEETAHAVTASPNDADASGARRKRRKRRRGRNRDQQGLDSDEAEADDDGPEAADGADSAEALEAAETVEAEAAEAIDNDEDSPRKRRRRNRRRRNGRNRADDDGAEAGIAADDAENDADEGADSDAGSTDTDIPAIPDIFAIPVEPAVDVAEEAPAKPKPKRTRRTRAKADAEAATEEAAPVEAGETAETAETVTDGEAEHIATGPASEEAPAKPRRTRRKPQAASTPEASPDDAPAKPKRSRSRSKTAATAPAIAEISVELAASEAPLTPSADDAEDGSQRRGWWQRTFGA